MLVITLGQANEKVAPVSLYYLIIKISSLNLLALPLLPPSNFSLPSFRRYRKNQFNRKDLPSRNAPEVMSTV